MDLNKLLKLGGRLKEAGYIRRLIAEKKIDISKINAPSEWLKLKYQLNNNIITPPDAQEEPIFNATEQVDYNVGKEKQKSKPTKQPTEAQQERDEENHRKLIHTINLIKTELQEYRKKIQLENSKYHEQLDYLNAPHWGKYKKELQEKGMKNITKDNVRELLIKRHRKNLEKLDKDYDSLIKYINANKLDKRNYNEILTHLNSKLNKYIN